MKSHVSGDEEQQFAAALQISAAEARRGLQRTASELQAVVEETQKSTPRKRSTRRVVFIAEPQGELERLIHTSQPKTRLDKMVLADSIRERLEILIFEQQNRAKLKSFGKRPSPRSLLVGPSSSGKTMTASALAGELHLHLRTIRLETLITRFLGETAAKMRLIVTKSRFTQLGVGDEHVLFWVNSNVICDTR